MTPSASRRSSRSWASRRPQPARSRKRASVICPDAGALLEHERARALVGRRRHRLAVAEADEPSRALEEAGELRVLDLGCAPAPQPRARLRAAARRRLHAARALPSRPAGRASSPAARTAAARARPWPRARWARATPGSSGSACVELPLELGRELGEPVVREAPLAVDERRRVDRSLAAARPLEASGIGMPGGRGIEHDAAADGRPVAEDDPVAARRDDRCGETQLREAAGLARRARARPPCRGGRGAARRPRSARAPRARHRAGSSAAGCRARRARRRDAARSARRRGARAPLAGPPRPARPGGRAPGRSARARRGPTAPRGARRPRRPSPTRASRSRPSRSRAARRPGRRRAAPRSESASLCF